MTGVNALIFSQCGFALPRVVPGCDTSHKPLSILALFNWRWNAPLVWPPSPSGFDGSLCPVIIDAVQVNRDDVAHVGLLQSTGVVASQTRPDGPRTDLCRRPCRVISGPFALITHRKPCRDTRRDVATSLFERVVMEGDDGRSRL